MQRWHYADVDDLVDDYNTTYDKHPSLFSNSEYHLPVLIGLDNVDSFLGSLLDSLRWTKARITCQSARALVVTATMAKVSFVLTS